MCCRHNKFYIIGISYCRLNKFFFIIGSIMPDPVGVPDPLPVRQPTMTAVNYKQTLPMPANDDSDGSQQPPTAVVKSPPVKMVPPPPPGLSYKESLMLDGTPTSYTQVTLEQENDSQVDSLIDYFIDK